MLFLQEKEDFEEKKRKEQEKLLAQDAVTAASLSTAATASARGQGVEGGFTTVAERLKQERSGWEDVESLVSPMDGWWWWW